VKPLTQRPILLLLALCACSADYTNRALDASTPANDAAPDQAVDQNEVGGDATAPPFDGGDATSPPFDGGDASMLPDAEGGEDVATPTSDGGSDSDSAATDADATVSDASEAGEAEAGLTCMPGETDCNGTCTTLSSDPNNCGTCSTMCGGDVCLNGQCCPLADAGVPCALSPQCGCPQTQMCSPVGTSNAPTCVPAGTVAQNQHCVALTDCQPGLTCSAGYCEPFCQSNSDCGPNWACLPQTLNGFAAGSACSEHCNPVSSYTSDATHQACNPGQQCVPLFNAQGQTACSGTAGAGHQGSACTSTSSCAANFLCAASGVCEQVCRIGFTDCSTGACTAFPSPQYDATQEIGLCQ